MSPQLCQAGGENPHCHREAVRFLCGSHWCQFHYDRIKQLLDDTKKELARLEEVRQYQTKEKT